jgi:hypothetical protein
MDTSLIESPPYSRRGTSILSAVEGRQVEPPKTIAVGDHVACDDLAALTVKPMSETGRAPTVTTTPAAPFTSAGGSPRTDPSLGRFLSADPYP